MAESGNHSVKLAEMQESLDQRDSLIEELTLRLEHTVEELDRMRRTGKSGGSAARGGGGLPSELVEQQTELASRLEEAVDHWEAAQPIDQLNRIEENIQHLFSALSSGKTADAAILTAAPVAKPASPPPAKSKPEKKEDSEDFWAATKARLMGESPAEAISQPAPSAPATTEGSPAEEASAVDETPLAESSATDGFADDVVSFETDENAPPAPKPLDELATKETLFEAVEERDTYIKYLTARLRDEQQRKVGRINWEALNAAPEKLAKQLQALQDMLDKQLKEAEISISLERASMTRQRAKLFQVKRQLEKEIMKIPASDSNGNSDSSEDSKDGGSRWGKLFSRE